jgi:aminoglycoside phosphotransferase (APT) family kinase protein
MLVPIFGLSGDAMSDVLPADALGGIIEQIAPGAGLVRAWPLRGGISARMTALELRLPDGGTRRVIVRQPGSPGAAGDAQVAAYEHRVLQLVRSVGVAAPAPLLLDESGTILPAPYLVVEFIDGEVEHSPADVAGFVGQVAAELARIHRIDGTRPELAALPRQADWLADARGARPVEADEALGPRRIRARLRDVAREGRPLPHPNPPALLHGDAWPGNMVWRDGRLAALIDWEEAHAGDPLEDLAIARFDVLSMLGGDAMAQLTRAYAAAQPQIDLTDLPYWDLYASLRPVNNISDWAGGWADLGRPDITPAVLRRIHGEFVSQAWEAAG